MNDPHVVALTYRIEHRSSVNYENAQPLEYECETFTVRIEKNRVRIEFKDHFATDDTARQEVGPFLRAWEIDVGLRHGPGELDFIFENAEIIDRKPTPGVLTPDSIRMAMTTSEPTLEVSRNQYPAPSDGFAVSAGVENMYYRYRSYCEDRWPIGPMGYFCLDQLEKCTQSKTRVRETAADKFGIAVNVLNTLGKLTSEKGGRDARKATGTGTEYSDAERQWLDAAVKTIIRRAAEVEHDPIAKQRVITMADLPKL